MNISSFFVRNYQFTIIIFLMVLVLGLNALFNMPRGEDPPFDAPMFTIVAVYPGTSPADMEELVAEPLEDRLYELDDIKKIVTTCGDGVVIMLVEFTYGVDQDAKNNEVVREVNRIRPELPEGLVSLETQKAASSDVVILQTALVSDQASYAELEEQARLLKKQLEKIRSLKRIEIQACPEERVQIQLDLEKMARKGISPGQVMSAIQAANINIPGGSLDISTKRYNIKTSSDLENMDMLRQVIVAADPSGGVVRLSEIAFIRLEEEDAAHIARFNGRRAIWVNSTLKDRKNIIETREAMAPVLEAFEAGLPDNIEMEASFDQAQNVSRRLQGLGRDFMIAVCLVLLTLVPLGWRASLVVMISIPLSLSIGLALLDALGFTLNQLSIVGMVVSLGLLVDDSIVIVENIERFLRMGYTRAQASILATKQLGVAVIGCTATLILAFLPLAFMPAASGDFIRSMPMAVILTVTASLFVALTIIPFLSSLILKPHEVSEGNFFFRAFKQYINKPYQRILVATMKRPVTTLLFMTALFLSSLLLIPGIGFSLFPASEKPMFVIDLETPKGTSIDETDRIARIVEERVMRQKGVASVSANVGKGNPRVYYNEFQREQSPNFSQLFVQMDPSYHVPQIVATLDTLRKDLQQIPGARIEVKQFQQGPPVAAPVEMRIFGDNLDTLQHLAARVEEMMRQTPGTRYINNNLAEQKTDLRVTIDRQKAGLFGIPLAEIARTVRLAMAGLEIGQLRTDEGKEYDLLLSIAHHPDEAMERFSRIHVSSLSGAQIPLNQIAAISLETASPLILHYNKERYTRVTSFVQPGFNTEQLTEQILDSLRAMDFPYGYSFIAAGERESREESFGGMGTIIIIAVFGLMAILVLEFRTFKSTLIVLSVIPLGTIGALVTLYLVGETLSFVATIGLIALVGIEIKNSILLVDYTNQLREGGMPLEQAVMEGAETRFLPILLTSMTAIGGLIPLVLEQSPLISPLAWVLIGGLISSTLLSRIVTPLLYRLLPPRVTVRQPENAVS